MTATQPAILAVHNPIPTPKMDDRKRSLAMDVDDPPSRKRHVKDEAGQQMRLEADKEKDLENFQKDAIYRQMKEYRREKKHYEELYNELNRKAAHHDDHLRAIDAWFAQLLDELRILAANTLPKPSSTPITSTGGEIYQSSLQFADQAAFVTHLRSQSDNVKAVVAEIFSRINSATPDVQNLQGQIASVLAQEKAVRAECERINAEKAAMNEQLDNAVWRYMKAEKALDRAKSAQVQKLERQAYSNASAQSPTAEKKAATPIKTEHSETNGDLTNGVDTTEAEMARKEAEAIAESRKTQLQEAEAENERLTNALSAARTKVVSLNNDDYAETALFKTVKSQYEDLITKINDLEAINVQLREEARKLQSERTSYRLLVDEETRAQTGEAEAQIAKCEVDLARIRNTRDELLSEVTIRKAAEDNRRTAADQARELAEARDKKIASLESQLERVGFQQGDNVPTTSSEELDALTIEELRSRFQSLEQQHILLGQELPSMEAAFRKVQEIAARKVADVADAEDKISRMAADKAKADQKYFAAMKAKDSRDHELKHFKAKDARSSEIMTQLKDADARSRELLIAQERQLTEVREVLNATERQYRLSEQKQIEAQTQLAGLRKQADDFKAMVGSKDEEMLALKKTKRDVETTLESCNARLEETKKQFETMRKTKAVNANTDADEWRRVAICPVCTTNIRNAAIRGCGHVFCNECAERQISNRSRKCPICGRSFDKSECMPIVLT